MNEIAEAVKGADKLILATDPDREGEAISWHILQILEQQEGPEEGHAGRAGGLQRRHQAGRARCAMRHPREIDAPLVDAYLARRALDYLVGFTLSPVLWRKLPGARSAGRVQSVALRLVCDREAEIEAFKARGILDDRGRCSRTAKGEDVPGPPRSPSTARSSSKLDIKDEATATRLKAALEGGSFTRRLGREEGASAATRRALHHLDPAAGGLAQARLLGQADHAGRPAPLRGRRHRRRDRRPHHLYANRRRARSCRRRSPPSARMVDASSIGERYLPRLHPRIQDQGQERAGGARGDPPDRLRASRPTRSPAISRTTRPGSTS